MLKHKKSPPASTGGEKAEILLELDLGAGFFQLLLDLFGVVLAGAFLDGLRSAVHQILGFLQAEAGDLTDNLDDVDLCLLYTSRCV